MKATLNRILFVLGIALAGAAFLAAGAEIAAMATNAALGLLPSAAEVWRTLAPGSYAEVLVHPHADLWAKILALPGWLLLGAPGLVLIIACHERGDTPSPEHEQSLFLFDELARRAREDGFNETADDVDAYNHPDFSPADPRYARDDVADDLIGAHDFLLDGKKSPPAKPDA